MPRKTRASPRRRPPRCVVSSAAEPPYSSFARLLFQIRALLLRMRGCIPHSISCFDTTSGSCRYKVHSECTVCKKPEKGEQGQSESMATAVSLRKHPLLDLSFLTDEERGKLEAVIRADQNLLVQDRVRVG